LKIPRKNRIVPINRGDTKPLKKPVSAPGDNHIWQGLARLRTLLMLLRPHDRRIADEKIRACRQQAGRTQEKWAGKADLHHNFIGEVERGNKEISLGSLLKTAKAPNLRVRDLVVDM
jgi:DNA-binding XRE family transcriptional regulator